MEASYKVGGATYFFPARSIYMGPSDINCFRSHRALVLIDWQLVTNYRRRRLAARVIAGDSCRPVGGLAVSRPGTRGCSAVINANQATNLCDEPATEVIGRARPSTVHCGERRRSTLVSRSTVSDRSH